MKYADVDSWGAIPRPLYFDGYHVNSSMERLAGQVEELAGRDTLELEPDFQRSHVWDDAQRTAYVEYVLMGGISSTTLYFNSTSWSNPEVTNGTFQLVDGLQRYTAVTKFINNEIPAFGRLYNEREGKMRGMPLSICINSLSTRKEVIEWYLLLNDGGVVHTRDELDRVRSLLEKEK